MKKIFILFLLCVVPAGVQAKSFKLGDFDLGKLFTKTEKVCTSGKSCLMRLFRKSGVGWNGRLRLFGRFF